MVSRISYFQLMFVILLSNGLTNHVIIIPVLLDVARRDSWLSVLAAGVIYLIGLVAIYYLYNRLGQKPLIEWLKQKYPPAITYFVTILLVLYASVLCYITVKDTVTWVSISFSPATPVFITTSFFLFVCYMNSVMGIRSIAMTSGVLLPVVVVLGFFVMSANFKHKDYSALLPIMEDGYQLAIQGIIYCGAGFSEIILLLLLTSKLKKKMTFTSLLFLGICLIFLTLGPLVGAIAEFGPDLAAKLRYPAYEEWRLASLGVFVEHLDFLSIFQWFSGAFIRVSLMLYLVVEALDLPAGKKRISVLTGLYLLVFLLNLLPISDIDFYRALVSFLLPGLLGVSLFVLILLLVLLSARKSTDGGT
ncbi:endospore germination permease [Brevibacillus dissolubilis]|uniref:endospore germination permease n=1 Tax=Brevibacillus dissolubilis TaxID=1844116 RepID=UPI0011165212|nr:endospore germination permease [Brevibacillus dissolubilis]